MRPKDLEILRYAQNDKVGNELRGETMDISKVDKNLAVEKTVDHTGLKIYDVLAAPFKVYGVMPPNDLGFAAMGKVIGDMIEKVLK